MPSLSSEVASATPRLLHAIAGGERGGGGGRRNPNAKVAIAEAVAADSPRRRQRTSAPGSAAAHVPQAEAVWDSEVEARATEASRAGTWSGWMAATLAPATAAAGLVVATAAWAQDEAAEATAEAVAAAVPLIDAGSTAWMLTATALVLMMTIPGLALFYGGMVRKTNLLATMMQSFVTACAVTIAWVVLGYSLGFAPGGSLIGGLGQVFMQGVDVGSVVGVIPESVFATFQLTFAIITPALLVGAFTDRVKFSSILLFVVLWLLVVYAPIAHWVWGGGFLMTAGVLDYAGGTVVHINAGVAGLVAAVVIGSRKKDVATHSMPHNLALSIVGAALLWVGWFGFNAGSAVAADGRAGMAMLVTQIGAAAAALGWMAAEWIARGKPSALGLISGAVAGLVAITPASGFVGPGGAVAIGAAAGPLCFASVIVIKRMAKADDSLDCFGIHGVGGIIGAILTGVFAREGIGGAPGLVDGNPGQVLTQLYGIAVTIAYCAVASFVLLKIVGALTGGLRVGEDAEREGLDVALHGEAVP